LLQPTDSELEVEFLASLSERTRYLRLMTPLRYLSQSLLAQLMDVDGRKRAALVATVMQGGAERFIAVARYAQTDVPGSAELGITVADAWQRRGVARRLLTLLLQYAHRQGIDRMIGQVLPDNVGMIALARTLGFETHFDAHTRLVHIEIDTASATT
jgi:acetyltransferase